MGAESCSFMALQLDIMDRTHCSAGKLVQEELRELDRKCAQATQKMWEYDEKAEVS